MTPYACPTCRRPFGSPTELWRHRPDCRTPWRPAWLARATDPDATRHPAGRAAYGPSAAR
jgi:hypothetical protein